MNGNSTYHNKDPTQRQYFVERTSSTLVCNPFEDQYGKPFFAQQEANILHVFVDLSELENKISISGNCKTDTRKDKKSSFQISDAAAA